MDARNYAVTSFTFLPSQWNSLETCASVGINIANEGGEVKCFILMKQINKIYSSSKRREEKRADDISAQKEKRRKDRACPVFAPYLF